MTRRDERGAAALEWTLVAPVLVMVICAMVAGWRLQSARVGLTHAAEAGARSASWERDANAADRAARAAVEANAASLPCGAVEINPDVSGFALPAGSPAAVSVRVRCQVALSDLLVPGLPGAVPIDVSASTPLDRYRER